jgi:hypothetical protein
VTDATTTDGMIGTAQQTAYQEWAECAFSHMSLFTLVNAGEIGSILGGGHVGFVFHGQL